MPAFAVQPGLRITPRAEVSFYGNWYECDAFDDTHGRLVRRRVFASTDAAALEALSGWPGLRTVLVIESIRSVNSAPTKVESEIRYFLSNCPDDPAVLHGPGP